MREKPDAFDHLLPWEAARLRDLISQIDKMQADLTMLRRERRRLQHKNNNRAWKAERCGP